MQLKGPTSPAPLLERRGRQGRDQGKLIQGPPHWGPIFLLPQ